MKLRTNVFDLWAFRRDPDEPRYLILRTSRQRADKWFGGGRVWQIPGGFFEEGEDVVVALRRILDVFHLESRSVWVIEHTYTYYKRRRNNLEIVSVFAAEVQGTEGGPLTWEPSEYRWATAAECVEVLQLRGLLEGLEWTRKYVTGQASPSPVFQLA